MVLRNVVPRQGTEMTLLRFCHSADCQLRNVVPRQGTEILNKALIQLSRYIEKCSSPTGDGNLLEAMNATAQNVY